MIVNKNITATIDSFSQFRILIIGDVMIDSYLWGKVDRISPEAPVPIISCTSQENRLGGAANVALNIQSLGAIPILCSVIGNDDRSAIFFELLSQQDMTSKGILMDKGRVTTMKTRIISNHQHLLRVDREIDTPLSKETETNFIKHILTVIEENHIAAIIFEDYDKGSITPDVITSVVSGAIKKGIPVLVDPKKRNFIEYKGVSLFKPNYKELVEGLKLDIVKTDPESLFEAAKILHTRNNIGMVMITLSEAGVFMSTGKEYRIVPAHLRTIADVSGAGDTVISVAALCLAAGLNPFDTAGLANMAGGLVCEKVGVVPIDKEQLKKETERNFV
jgi:D-glycero-beta-D-manno-heptose-7-phosphate kinase